MRGKQKLKKTITHPSTKFLPIFNGRNNKLPISSKHFVTILRTETWKRFKKLEQKPEA